MISKNRERLIEKWSKQAGKMSIAGIKDFDTKSNLAQLLENQATGDMDGNDMFLTEGSEGLVTYGQMSTDSQPGTGMPAGDAWKFRPVALALVRRTFPDLFANKIVGVQAMATPVGLAYALRVVYNDGNGQEAAWDKVAEYAGYTGNQVGASGTFRGANPNTSAATGIYDTSGAGTSTSGAEGWLMPSGRTWTATSTSGTTTVADASTAWPQLKLRIDQRAIEATSRKLAASFSLEAAQDIRAMHGLDIEREMVNILQYEITAEMDRELLTAVKVAATDTANGGASISAIDLTGNTASGLNGIDGRWSGEKYMNVIASIVHQQQMVGIATKRAPANFVVVSPGIATCLQSAGHQFVAYNQNVNATTTMTSIGKLNGTMDVYRDFYAPAGLDYAMVGLKGNGVSDAGVLFCPYIMGLTNRAISPSDYTPRVGVMSRYAIVSNLLGAGRYYRIIPYFNTAKLIAGA
jgi:hypothetical protein